MNPNETSQAPVSPETLLQMAFSMAPHQVLHTALRLDMFSHIARGAHSAAEIAQAANASERGTRMLLDAAAAFGLLTKHKASYEMTPLSQTFLVRESPAYIGAMMEDTTVWESWGRLEECVRQGEGAHQVQQETNANVFFPTLIKSLHVLGYVPSQRMAQALKPPVGAQILDVACGSAVWSIPFAEADAQAHLTLQDFPAVLEHTRGYVQRHGVASRCDYLPGNLREVDYGDNRFDVAVLGNIVHSEGEKSSRDLFARLHRALKPGGKISIVDMIPNDERSGPPFALIFALNMLVNTKEGDTYTLTEYTDWLHDAGFSQVETVDVGSHSPIIVATKAA